MARIDKVDPQLPQAAQGECVALLGPRSASRSAMLASIVNHQGGGALLISPVDPLFRQLDVEGNVAFPLRKRGINGDDRARAVRDLLALAGLDGIASGPVRHLSAALRARVVLARAFAASRPLVLDDPFAALSTAERPPLQVLLRRLIQQLGTAVVLATSERSELFACGDKVGVIEDGRVDGIGFLPAMLDDPGSAFAARSLTDAQLFPGRVQDEPEDCNEADVHLACGATMPARLANHVEPGGLCLVAVRPDRIAVAAVRTTDLGGRAIPATLLDVRHLGDHVRLRLKMEDGSDAWIRRPVGSLTPLDIKRASQPLGASLAWRSSDATAFPHPQA